MKFKNPNSDNLKNSSCDKTQKLKIYETQNLILR